MTTHPGPPRVDPEPPPEVHHEVHHEASDIDAGRVVASGAGLFAAAVVIHLAIYLMFLYFERREAQVAPAPPLQAADDRLPPPPRLQDSPRLDLEGFLARERELLENYRWVDRDAGVVRIPIAEAMRLVLERGLPVYEPPVLEPAPAEPPQ